MAVDVVVVGQLARDLVLVVDDVPEAGESRPVRERREMLGGKGANQAVGLAPLGLHPALIAVAGDDEAGDRMLEQARADGIDVSAVARRRGARTGLIVDVVDRDGRWRYLEDLPGPVLLSEGDIRPAAPLFSGARWASLQLQQPAAAVLAAAGLAWEAGCRVLLDGAPPDAATRDRLLGLADVVRADAREAEMLAGAAIGAPDDAGRAAAAILDKGPALVVLAVGEAGNYFAWRGQGRGTAAPAHRHAGRGYDRRGRRADRRPDQDTG